MSGRMVRGIVVVPVLVALWSLVMPAPVGTATEATPGLRKVTRTAAFHTQGQSLWGRGTGQTLASDVPIFDVPWNESGSIGSITSICIVPHPFGGCITSADFGATLGGTTSGRVGLLGRYELGAGALAIDYPVQVAFRMPRTFTPGTWATIGTSLEILPGAKITTVTPDGHIDLNGVFGFFADARAKGCLVSCAESTSEVRIPTVSGRLFRIDNTTVHDFTELELQTLGLSGSVQLPDLAVGPTTVNADRSLSAAGSGEYAEIGISAIEWALKLAGLELPLNFDLPLCCGVSAGYTSFDSTFSVTGVATQALKFTPNVRLMLRFPRKLDFVVHTRSGVQLASGLASSVIFRVGQQVDIRIPANQTTPLNIVPTARIDRNRLVNDTTTDISFGGEVTALEAHATVPEHPPFFAGVDFRLGPVYQQEYPIADLPRIDIWSDQWRVAGFTPIAMDALTIRPA